MNEMALALNRTLEGTVASELFSDLGRRLYFPKGIVAQAAEAGKLAKRLNATVGMAVTGGQAMHMPSIKAHIQGLTPNEIFAYAGPTGSPELREAWKREMLQKNPSLAGKATSLPAVVAGLTHGIAVAAELFVGAGDVVLMPDLCWDNYWLLFEDRLQAEVHTFPLFDPQGGLDPGALSRALRRHGRSKAVVLLNFPNNPTGYSPTAAEAEAVLQVLAERARAGQKILALFDDAYFGLYYEQGLYRQSLFAEAADMHENLLAVKVDGPTKENLVWGFRIGFLTFAAAGLRGEHFQALEQKVMGAIRSSVSSSSQLAQSLLLKAMRGPDYEKEKREAFDVLAGRYRRARELAARAPAVLKALPFNSGYFMTFAVENSGAEALRQSLLARGAGAIAFGDRYLRVAYSGVEEEKLEELYGLIFEEAGKLTR
jgi:aspartate/methionine/tyrosine aminotransferase